MTEPFTPTSDMRGDFSRIRFDPSKNYTAVLAQQGRVALDSDANEESLIEAYQSATQLIDIIGESGGPVGDEGFSITLSASFNDILIGAGRYYVEGLLCENRPSQNQQSISYENQPYPVTSAGPTASDLLTKLKNSTASQVLRVYLQVWQRLQTALDDPGLLEPAIGTADTTARLQTVWRVIADVEPKVTDSFPPIELPGKMSASTAVAGAECGCGPVAAAGYQGVENQLYRVEIHNGTDQADNPTFKWSRENGSVVVAVTAPITGSKVTVSSLGPDANLGFQVGQWVELTDDTLAFGYNPISPGPNSPGTLYQIHSIQPADPSVTLIVPAGQTIAVDPAQHARMRRWDQSDSSATTSGVPLSEGEWVPLENGIQVQFSGGPYHSGDYWTIPARAATGDIDWPQDQSVPPKPVSGSPTSVQVHQALLATISFVSGQFQPQDARQPFKPLTALNAPAAIHVQTISWTNDDVVTLDQLVATGITITLDQPPASPITPANFIVTVEPAYSPPLGASPPATILGYPVIVASQITPTGPSLSWTLPYVNAAGNQQDTILEVDALLLPGAAVQKWALVRVRLLGQAIYATGAAGPVYLDGKVLGQNGLRADGTARIALNLNVSSRSGALASDFEGWFYVAPTLMFNNQFSTNPQNLTFNFPAAGLTVTADSHGDVASLAETGSNTPVTSPTATVTLNYPAAIKSSLTVALTGTGATIATVPNQPVPIPIGALSVPIPVKITGNPGAGVTQNVIVTATLTSALGDKFTATGNFTVTGGAPSPHGTLGGNVGGPGGNVGGPGGTKEI